MSFLLAPVVNAVVYTASSSVTTIVWYTAGGIWWAGKRLIYGKQQTAEEIQQIYQKRQIELDEQILAQLKQQTEMLKTVSAPALMCPPHIHLIDGTFNIEDSENLLLTSSALTGPSLDNTTTASALHGSLRPSCVIRHDL